MRESLIVIDKVPGPTSFDVVREVKKVTYGAKVGHTGSLDPFASGCLVLLIGKATRLSQALLDADKRYVAKACLGRATDSMDRTGETIEEAAVPEITAEQMAAVLKSYEGEWLQTPPMFSAKKIHGVRLYELARQKINVPRAAVNVQLYEMKLLEFAPPFVTFEVHCSKGTYIRSLADDIGRKLGTVAYLHDLRRLACGEFTLDDGQRLDEFLKSPADFLEKGFQNYVRLVRREMVVRGGGLQAKSGSRHMQLQLPNKSDNSFIN